MHASPFSPPRNLAPAGFAGSGSDPKAWTARIRQKNDKGTLASGSIGCRHRDGALFLYVASGEKTSWRIAVTFLEIETGPAERRTLRNGICGPVLQQCRFLSIVLRDAGFEGYLF